MDNAATPTPGPRKEPAPLLRLAIRLGRAAGRGALAALTLAACVLVGGVLGAMLIKPLFVLVAWVWTNTWPH